MFSILLNRLGRVYKGQEIYVPDAIYPLIIQWMESHSISSNVRNIRGKKDYHWNGKMIYPLVEEEMIKAYQSCLIHVPQRILEQSIVVETSLREPEQQEQTTIVREKKTLNNLF